METASIIFLIFAILAIVAMVGLFIFFIVRFLVYGYIGNVYLYVVSAYLICFMMSVIVNLNPLEVVSQETIIVDGVTKVIETNKNNVEFGNKALGIPTAFFDALKMMALAFDKSVIAPYFKHGDVITANEGAKMFFGGVYYVTSGFALLTTSIGVILFIFKSFVAKLVNFFKLFNPKREIYYIFSEAKVAGPAIKLANVLKADKHVVIMYISKASLKTQEGTEYRDALINEGLDVRNENFSKKLAGFIFKNFIAKSYGLRRFLFFPWLYRNRKVTVYGLFDDDDSSIELATAFRVGIAENWLFYKLYRDYLPKNSNPNDKPWRIRQKEKKAGPIPQLDFDSLSDEEKKNLALKADKYLKTIENFRVFVTYQEWDVDKVHNFSGQTLHMVNTLSQYDMVSSEFVLNNPIINFLPTKKDKDTGKEEIIVDDSNIDGFNVSFFGFGSINRPIFDKMSHAYQLWDDYGHKIHFHIYDYKSASIVSSLANEYLEKPKRLEVDEIDNGEYFQKPQLFEIDARLNGEDLTQYGVLDKEFKEIKDKDPEYKRFNPHGFEIFVVSATSTNSDVQIATSLRHVMMKHFSVERLKRTFIFVRIGNEEIANSILNDTDNKNFITQEDFNAHKYNDMIVPIIIFGKNTNMAEFIDKDYETLIKLGKTASSAYNPNMTEEETNFDWAKLNKTGVLNNIATTYSLKTKLAIIGFDLDVENRQWIIKDKATGKALSQSDYQTAINKLKSEANFEDASTYDCPMMRLARLEHNRWLATMFSLFKQSPMSKKEYNQDRYVRANKSRTPDRERHVCMTTNKGLHDLYKFAIAHGLSKEKAYKLAYENDIAIMDKVFKTMIELFEKNNAKRKI